MEWGVPPIADGFFLKTNEKKNWRKGGVPPHNGRKKQRNKISGKGGGYPPLTDDTRDSVF